ncbi:MAG: Na+/H+ antiporter [bacterium]|nr:Na+/H+ antiporter [bacterium]
MIHDNLLLILSLLFAVFMLVMLAQKLKISYPIFLVIGGLLIGLIPGIPNISIDPQLIFLIFLPPLLYEAAWFTSWHEFWKWKRAIGMLAFGLVIFTSVIVALVSSAMIPGFTLAMGFLLGGIISPPDAVAATSVLKGVKVPRRVITILEGESLINDASSLVVFRFAVAAVVSGTFVLETALVDFFLVTVMGIVIGLAVAHIVYVIHRFFPTTPSIDAALTIMTPYVMYVSAEHFHYSGVMAVVSGGLFLSFRSNEIFNHKSRIQAYGFWKTLIFILNGLVFILIGLQLPVIVAGLEGYSITEAIKYGLIISVITILIRFIWMYPAAFIPRYLSKKIRTHEANPGWKTPLIVSWAGMRGVVSLASALSIPLLASGNNPFPHRNLILFITFIVIFITLVIQGLSLPLLIRLLKLEEIDGEISEAEQETGINVYLKKAALKRLNEKYKVECTDNELIDNMKKQLESDIGLSVQKLESLKCDDFEEQEVELMNEVVRDLIAIQRKELFILRKKNLFTDEVLRKQEAQLDLDEAKISPLSD